MVSFVELQQTMVIYLYFNPFTSGHLIIGQLLTVEIQKSQSPRFNGKIEGKWRNGKIWGARFNEIRTAGRKL
jgi:hypothetical protein